MFGLDFSSDEKKFKPKFDNVNALTFLMGGIAIGMGIMAIVQYLK